MLTHMSLFSGIGGLDLAAEWAGFKTVGQCEWADYPTKILEKHWPDVARWRDIRSVTKESFYNRTGLRTVTVVSGGFPCQPFSTAGKRKGAEDDRYLWPEMLRVISELQPTWAIGENVAGLISMAQSTGEIVLETETAILKEFEMVLETIRRDFEQIGYESQPMLIPACAVGARHRRDRIFIMARNTKSNSICSIDQIPQGKDSDTGRICADVDYANSNGLQGRISNESQEGCYPYKVDTVIAESSNVSNSDSRGLQGRTSEGMQECTGKRSFGKSGAFMADTESERCREEGCNCQRSPEWSAGSGIISNTTEELWERDRRARDRWPEFTDGSWWDIEPNVGRVANGVPNRVDRLKCLGNAVVPQQAYPIFQAIHNIETGTYLIAQ